MSISRAQRATLKWQIATASGGNACVEVAQTDAGVVVRHSRYPQGAVLRYTVAEWHAFLDGAKKGEFDHLVN